MNCLTTEQLAQVVLDPAADRAARAHVESCPACRQRLAQLAALDDRLLRAHRRYEADHERQRTELMAALEAEDGNVRPAPAARPLRTWIGGLTMVQKTMLGGVGAAALLAATLLWAPNTSKRASAMDQMAEEVRKAKSYEMTMEMHFDKISREKLLEEPTGKIYWQAPRSYRSEFAREKAGDAFRDVMIFPSDKPGIDINHEKKEFRRQPARRGQMPAFVLLNGLGRFSGDAEENLGTREIDGRAARGFKVDARKIDPDVHRGPVEIWLDTDTNLPVRVEYDIEDATPRVKLVMRDIHWNVELDPELFDAAPPAGYADVTPDPLPPEKVVSEITGALRTYAELAGEYPQAKTVYGDVTSDEMYRMIGIQNGRPTPEQTGTKAYGKVSKAMYGFALLNGKVFRENPDGAYYGLTVGPNDADKVLLRWQLDDGRYQVIYGDLRDEIVSRQRLRELESR